MKTVNPSAVTGKSIAFAKGAYAAQHGHGRESCPYPNPELREAWLRGYQRFEKRIREILK